MSTSVNVEGSDSSSEHDKALSRVLIALMKDDTELFRQFSDNEGFRRWLADTVFNATYESPAASQ